jgi:antitoxin HicB
MAFGYRYTLEQQENGWWLVRFIGLPEALTEGETEEEARANARDCLITALEGYMKAGRPLPRKGAGHSGRDRAVLPSLVTAKLAVYEEMRARGWSKVKFAKELGMSENSVRRLLDLHHSSHMWIIDEALAKMNAELSIDLLDPGPQRKDGMRLEPICSADRSHHASPIRSNSEPARRCSPALSPISARWSRSTPAPTICGG